jgi:prolyl-tRNA synthetase
MPNQHDKKEITKKSKNISDWYTDVVLKAGLADYGPVRGTMVIRPYGYALWEVVQRNFDKMFKSDGVQNAYFPIFIPYSLLTKEKEHIDGFSPELALVTHGGGEELAEPLVVRPTSETIMYEMYSKWIQSWRDLPLKINQWNNVVRWEKRTYLFIRTLEFLWQEGHCAHATHEECLEMVHRAANWYKTMYEDYFALPVVMGKKSESEKFAGALTTYTVEALMPDGKALQACTSHDLGQNFSKAQNISFQDKDGNNQFVWQNSWGFSTRSLGGLILSHGDDQGLILPPRMAPIKVVIVPILGKNDEKVLKYCERVKSEILSKEGTLYEGNVQIWDDPEKSFGWKVNEAELKGIPLRIVIGTREADERTVTVKSRVSEVQEKLMQLEGLGERIETMLSEVQQAIYNRAKKNLEENTRDVANYQEFKEIMNKTRGFIRAHWCESAQCEAKIKEETKATTRCLPLESKEEEGTCVYCGKDSKHRWLFAQAY